PAYWHLSNSRRQPLTPNPLPARGGAREFLHRRLLRHERAPAAERRDIARAVDIGGLDDEAFYAAAIGEPYRPDRQRRRDRSDEFSERGRGQGPEFELDRRPLARFDAQHAGFWRRRAQRIELVVRRGDGFLEQASAERFQFAVERHGGEMRADHGDGDLVAACAR